MKKESASDWKPDDALDREIRALLTVEPSTEYVARIRRRVASEPAPATWRLGWMIPAMAATAAILLVMVQRPHERIRSDGSTTPMAAGQQPAGSSAAATAPAAPGRAPKPSKPQERQPELLIAANEAAALRRLWSDPTVQLPVLSEPADVEVREIVIEPIAPSAPITIKPIETPAAVAEEGVQ